MPSQPDFISTRRVYYFGGFDPRGPGYYHKLFSSEAQKNNNEEITINISTRIRTDDKENQWLVSLNEINHSLMKTNNVHTTHVFMGWDDIIRMHWDRSARGIIYSFFSNYLNYASWSALNRVRKHFLPAFFSGIFPFAFFIFYLSALFLVNYFFEYFFGNKLIFIASIPLKLILQLATLLMLSYFTYQIANRLGIFWLLRIYRFNILFAGKKINGIESRQHLWVEKIIEHQTREPVDEVIFSGHSVGTLLLVGVIDALLADERWQRLQGNKHTQILTLGQCYPFITLMPAAVEFRQSLQRICEDDRITWLDVTARIDPLCFYRMHPLQHTDIDISELSRPVLYSARFFKMYDPERWKKIKKNKMLVHFLYLMMPDRKFGFNLYDIFYGTGNFRRKVVELSHAGKPT